MIIDPKATSTESTPPIENDQLVIGEIVRLRSGGPVMTVSFVDPYNTITCIWFDEKNKLQFEKLVRQALVRVK
jgi:uncharacterized protein YodC (DUF2158 family)